MNAPNLYDPTPAEMATLAFDLTTCGFHSKARVVLDLRGVTLTHRPQVAQTTVDPDALGIWRNLMAHDLKLAREIADQKRRRLFLAVAPFGATVSMERDGARFCLGVWPTAATARAFVENVADIYAEQGVPLRVDL